MLPVFIPSDLNSELAFLNNSDECNKDFEGIHPILRQVPPKAPLDSIQAVFFPNCDAPVSYTHLTLPTTRGG